MIGSIRTWINAHPAAAGIVGVAIVATGIGVAILRGSGKEVWHDVPTARAFFVDLDDLTKVTVRPRTDIPPLANEKGEQTIVRAVFMTQSDVASKQLVYLEKYTPEIKEQLEGMVRSGASWVESGEIAAGHLVRAPATGSPWVPMDSVEGCRIVKGTFSPVPRAQVVNP